MNLASSEQFDALIAIGVVIRGETYHFELVSNESGAGVSRVAAHYNIPIANAILTRNDEQAVARIEEKSLRCRQSCRRMCQLSQSSFFRTIRRRRKNKLLPRIEYSIFSDGLPIMTLRPSESFNIQPTTLGTLFTRNTHEKPTPPRTRACRTSHFIKQASTKLPLLKSPKNIRELSQAPNMDEELFNKLFFGAQTHAEEYMEKISPLLDRDEKDLSPIERAVLLVACHELSTMPETPILSSSTKLSELPKLSAAPMAINSSTAS